MLSYKFDDLIYDQTLSQLLDSNFEPVLCPVVVHDSSNTHRRIAALLSSVDADVETTLTDLYGALLCLPPSDPIPDSIDPFPFLSDALRDSRTPVVHLSLKCLLALYLASPCAVRDFVHSSHPLLTRLVRSPTSFCRSSPLSWSRSTFLRRSRRRSSAATHSSTNCWISRSQRSTPA
jgi:hypothetical protein